MIAISLFLDGKKVRTQKLDDNASVEKYLIVARKMVRKYDGYPFLQVKSTKKDNDCLTYDLETFKHQSSVLEIRF